MSSVLADIIFFLFPPWFLAISCLVLALSYLYVSFSKTAFILKERMVFARFINWAIFTGSFAFAAFFPWTLLETRRALFRFSFVVFLMSEIVMQLPIFILMADSLICRFRKVKYVVANKIKRDRE